MQSLKSIRQAEVDNFFKQSFEQKKLIPLYQKTLSGHFWLKSNCSIEVTICQVSGGRAVKEAQRCNMQMQRVCQTSRSTDAIKAIVRCLRYSSTGLVGVGARHSNIYVPEPPVFFSDSCAHTHARIHTHALAHTHTHTHTHTNRI